MTVATAVAVSAREVVVAILRSVLLLFVCEMVGIGVNDLGGRASRWSSLLRPSVYFGGLTQSLGSLKLRDAPEILYNGL